MTMTERKNFCGGCKWFYPWGTATDGRPLNGNCRRLSAQFGRAYREWPVSFVDDWCDEFQPNTPAGA